MTDWYRSGDRSAVLLGDQYLALSPDATTVVAAVVRSPMTVEHLLDAVVAAGPTTDRAILTETVVTLITAGVLAAEFEREV
ncbi:MAG: hypothetical protein F2667_12235 [Actinobacteria bacterium]|nr:hypothetical protein [Actinomycetota bacterium]